LGKQKQTRIKQKVMNTSELCEAKAVGKALLPTQPKMEDDLGILPPSMRKNFLATMNRNREAFEALANYSTSLRILVLLCAMDFIAIFEGYISEDRPITDR
jgi:hypothetical protein